MSEPVRHRVEIAPRTLFLVLGIIAGVVVVAQLTAVITILTIALVLVGTLDPLVAWLERKGLGRGRALVLVMMASALAFAAVVLLMVPPLVAQAVSMIEGAPDARDHLIHSLRGYTWGAPIIAELRGLPLDKLSERAASSMLGYSMSLFELVGFGVSTLFLAIYMLADPARSKALIYAVVPRHHHVKLAKILLELKVIVGGYMRGQLITSLAISAFVFALLTVLGADNALPLALFAGLTDVIPFVGGYLASAPVVIAVVPNGTTTTVIVAGLMMLYQEFESRILVPRVYGSVLRLPPAVVLLALLVGGVLAGILGALLALPIAAGLQMLITELRVDLPGTAPAFEAETELDERASEVYEQLTEGASSTVDAGIVADNLATMVKRSETEGVRLSAQLASMIDPDAL